MIAGIALALAQSAAGAAIATNGATVEGEAKQAAETASLDRDTLREVIRASIADDRAVRDLRAQEDMARWAFWMLVVAVVSTAGGLAGLFLIWKTLDATRAAVREAEAATLAAQASVKIAEGASQAQLRAWLQLDVDLVACMRTAKAAHFTFKMKAKNVGLTPALHVASDIRISGEPGIRVGYGDLPERPDHLRPLPSLMPGEETEITIELRMMDKAIAAAGDFAKSKGTGPVVIVDTVLAYSTIFDTEMGARMTSARHVVTSAYYEKQDDWLQDDRLSESDVRFGRDLTAPVHMS